MKCDYLAETPSTSLRARDHADALETKMIFVTSLQTQGRGRGQNTWEARKAGTQLTATWAFSMPNPPGAVTSAKVGLLLVQSLKDIWGDVFALKAPNDVYIRRKKLAGLLLENLQTGPRNVLLVGLGLNVFGAPDYASFLQQEMGTPITQESFLGFLNIFSERLNQLVVHDIPAFPQTLNAEQRRELLHYLNKFEGLREAYFDILPEGSLKSQNSLIHWSDL
jgi:BirA family biotin operon repressor/biotin-[acetyl-CoA-carboxylase] ligase